MTTKWTKEVLTEEAKKYRGRNALKSGKPGAYKAALRLGLMDELFPKAPRKGKEEKKVTVENTLGATVPQDQWNEGLIHNESSKFKSFVDFKTHSPDAYNAMIENLKSK